MNDELQQELTDALRRALNGTATRDDVRLLCFGCGINPADIGIPPRHRVVSVPLNEVIFGTF